MKIGTFTAAMGVVLLATTSLQQEARSASELQTVTAATSATGRDGYLALLIEARGISRKHGLKINNLFMDFTEAGNALRLGRATVSMMQPSTAVNLRKSGTDVKLLVAKLWSGNVFLVRKDAPYKNLEDLKGKKVGNFSRVTGAYFLSAIIAKEHGLDIEKDFQTVPAETGALIALLERGEAEAINMFDPHTTRLLLTGRYRVLLDFDTELNKIFGTPPLKSSVAVLKETVDKQPDVVKALRATYLDGIKVIKSGEDKEFYESKAREFFGLKTPEEIALSMKANRENFADPDTWGEAFFRAQNKILQKGIALGLLPNVGNLDDLWLR
jgi:ABC-type nitrate/sulfonate/bicarbonate transport system substrate-binding protein